MAKIITRDLTDVNILKIGNTYKAYGSFLMARELNNIDSLVRIKNPLFTLIGVVDAGYLKVSLKYFHKEKQMYINSKSLWHCKIKQYE